VEDTTTVDLTEVPGALQAPARSRTGPAPSDVARMTGRADQAASFLKALSHEGRLMILCHLATGEKSVTELEQLLGVRQAAVSQQLSRLRLEGLVSARRDGKTIHYSILDPKVMRTVVLLHDLFCPDE
jgi:DNA-binding transcriptional ArsR family regulator